MKNLLIIGGKSVEFNVDIVGHCIDSDNRTIYVLAKDLSILCAKTGESLVTRINYKLDETESITSDLQEDDVILVDFIVENRSIVIALKNGIILQISLLSDEPTCRVLYHHKTVISSIRYSPNQDLVALADCNNELTIFTTSYEPIDSTNALEENNSAHKPVGVGWGSKETQFFGLDGRPSKEKEKKDQEVLEASELKVIEDIESSSVFKSFASTFEKSTVLDWRGDGHFLATLTFIPDASKHYLKVWNRNLELQYISEQLVTVERGLISWIPNGQYICLAQRRDQRVYEIALFEKNGMVHQRITLPQIGSNLYYRAMSWSPDSKILALVMSKFELSGDNVECKNILFLYTMQNFRYYLKHSTYLESTPVSPRWDQIDCRLQLMLSSGQYRPLDCRFHVDYTKEHSTTFVVDANRLLITPLDLCNVPPPMSAIELTMPDLINGVITCPRKNRSIFVLTLNGKLLHFNDHSVSGDEVSSAEFSVNVNSASELSSRFSSLHTIYIGGQVLQHLKCISKLGRCSLVAIQRADNKNMLILIDADQGSHPTILLDTGSRNVMSIAQNSLIDDDKHLALIFDDGSVDIFDLELKDSVRKYSLIRDMTRLSSGFIDSQLINVKDEELLLTLSTDLTMRTDGRIISSNCTSFRITEHYLVYTTTDNYVHLILLESLSAIESGDIVSWTQPIENGGTLISASEQSMKIVLQMPRGNLETLHLRIFIFTSLTSLLSAGNYVDAIKLARRHRVNLNFLCDYLLRFADATFLITKFAATIAEEDPALLNLFISELDNSDTISDRGRYENIMRQLPSSSAIPKMDLSAKSQDKVNQICSYILLPEDPKYLQPRLLCLLTFKPSRTAEALRIIHELPNESKESCLRFVLYFINIEQLFLESIKTYNTDIALMVAGASNKDPKEYLALLDGFNSTENLSLRTHQMDMYVGNYESAFDNLLEYHIDAEDKQKIESQLVDLVVSKRIFKHATGTLNKRPNHDKLTAAIWSRYADYLLEKRHYLEAGVAYSKALALSDNEEHFVSALKCFFLADNFDISLALIARSNVKSELKSEYRSKITKQLFKSGKSLDAIAITHNVPDKMLDENAAEMVDQGNWYLAEYFSSEESRPNIRASNLLAILEHCDNNLQSIVETLRSAKTHYDRLIHLLENYQDSRFNNPDGENLADSLSTIDGSEVSSLTASAVRPNQKSQPRSGAPSLKTRASSKSTRSQIANKKRINLKQGSRHEDIALVLELQKFVTRSSRMHENSMKISAALYTYCDLNLARDRTNSMQQVMSECHELAKKIIETLWPHSIQSEEDEHSLYRRFGSNLLISPSDHLDNTDLQVLMRPELPKSPIHFEL